MLIVSPAILLSGENEGRMVQGSVMSSEVEKDDDSEKPEFDHFTIGSLSVFSGPLETIKSDAPVEEAISKMLKKRYSQLPVLDKERHECIGSVTLESILRVILNEATKAKLNSSFLSWHVKRFIDKDEEANYVNPDGDVMKYTEIMADRGYVLVGSPKNVKGILTNYDLVLFFKRKTEPFLLLREIETSLRYAISKKLTCEELKAALKAVKTEDGHEANKLEELTLNDLRQLISTRWDLLEDLFVDREKTDAQLGHVCRLRNQILHFRARLFASHLADLKDLRNIYVKIALDCMDK